MTFGQTAVASGMLHVCLMLLNPAAPFHFRLLETCNITRSDSTALCRLVFATNEPCSGL